MGDFDGILVEVLQVRMKVVLRVFDGFKSGGEDIRWLGRGRLSLRDGGGSGLLFMAESEICGFIMSSGEVSRD